MRVHSFTPQNPIGFQIDAAIRPPPQIDEAGEEKFERLKILEKSQKFMWSVELRKF